LEYCDQFGLLENYAKALDDYRLKLAFLVHDDYQSMLINVFRKTLDVLKREKYSFKNVICTRSTYILVHSLDEVSARFIEAGLMTHLYNHGFWTHTRPVDEEVTDHRRVFSMSDLEFGFTLWLAACFVAFLLFLCEQLSLKVRRKLKVMAGLFEFLRLVRARMSDYHDTW
jgi:hypothetical protein